MKIPIEKLKELKRKGVVKRTIAIEEQRKRVLYDEMSRNALDIDEVMQLTGFSKAGAWRLLNNDKNIDRVRKEKKYFYFLKGAVNGEKH